ncbi:MAG: GNAT family N-acetyltransferase [Cyanobacteriota bacterium ELA615]
MQQYISQATYADIPALCLLLEHLFTQESEFQPDAQLQAQGLESIISNPKSGQIFVLHSDKAIIGMASLLYSISTALGGYVALLEDVIIHPDYRGLGHGSILLQHVLQYAQDKGYKRLTLLSDIENLQAQKFYQKHGFIKISMLPMQLIF